MIINKIILQNVFLYDGTNEFNFTTQGEKNIVLIVGENGFGKTSFINALKIGFHGITKELLKNNSINKEHFIKGNDKFEGLITQNRDVAKIEIQTDIFTIIREFGYEEKLTLLKDGETYTQTEAQDIIESFFPSGLNRFFFFDAEKIQEIADFENEEFKKMLEAVLKLNIYDTTINDLKVLYKKYLKSSLDSESLKQLELLERTEQTLKTKIQNLEEKLKNLQEAIKEAQKKEKLFINKSSEIKKTEQTLNLKKEEFNNLIMKFKHTILYQLPLILNPQLFEKIKKDVENYDDLGVDKEILLRKKEEFLTKIKNSDPSLEKIFDEVFLKNKKSFINSSKILPLLHITNKNFVDLLDRLSLLKSQIEALEKSKYYDNELFKDIIDIQKKILTLQNEFQNTQEELFNAKEQLNQTQKEIRRISKIEFEEKLTKEKITTVINSIKALKEIKASLKAQKKPILQRLINEKFTMLKKDTFDIDKIILNDDFSIMLIKKNKAVSVLSASSGQKQIIATSLIWAVSEYMERNLPMIIDTPLGRLDTQNQKLLLEKFYPNASKQTFMLATPSELRAKEFKTLTKHISDKYTLTPQTPKVKRCVLPNS